MTPAGNDSGRRMALGVLGNLESETELEQRQCDHVAESAIPVEVT
jgi:hypothetical protein